MKSLSFNFFLIPVAAGIVSNSICTSVERSTVERNMLAGHAADESLLRPAQDSVTISAVPLGASLQPHPSYCPRAP